MIIKADAPGKLILLGEYAVLEGAPALVCAVDRKAIVTIKKSSENTISASSIDICDIPFKVENKNIIFNADLDKNILEKLIFFKSTFDYCLQNISYDFSDRFYNMDINTDAFYSEKVSAKLGFGSSAALTVALLKALFKIAAIDINIDKNRYSLFRLALAAHKKAQNNIGSGIDIAASSFSGVLEYRMAFDNVNEALIPIKLEPWEQLPMCVIYTGKSESTRKMVFGVNQLKQSEPDLYNELIEELTATSTEGSRAYQDKNLFGFLNAVRTYNTQMDMLGKNSAMPIISELHQKIARIVLQNSGVYKPSGAGSGDVGIAFAESFVSLSKIEKAVVEAGFQTLNVNISH